MTAVAADFDSDGWPDIYVACDSTPSWLFRNQRDGTFREEGLERGGPGRPRSRLYGMMVLAVDITEHVSARRVLERAQGEREKLLEELKRASRAKDEFLAMLGHELRNPLSPILTALQLMRGVRGADREREIIERQVRHMVGLVDNLLDISGITRGKIALSANTCS